MKTVNEALRDLYPARLVFSRRQRRYMRSKGITNGVGAADGINISQIIVANVKFFPQFDEEKVKQFVLDVEKGSDGHDIEYLEGNTLISRIRADWRFAKFVKRLCHWTSKKHQRKIFWIVFLVLFKWGGPAYNYGEKKYIENILPDNIK